MSLKIDAHQHFWDLSRFSYPWMQEDGLEAAAGLPARGSQAAHRRGRRGPYGGRPGRRYRGRLLSIVIASVGGLTMRRFVPLLFGFAQSLKPLGF